ncbi:MAG TPA: AEC family transporter [Gammaproteobacteria bacterium]|nr:AEC family transporter [Gammaproteobacteria bacterium]
MSALLMLFGCLVLGVLVARFARPPANMVAGLNWWVLRIALPALVLELIPGLGFDPNLWYPPAVLWLGFLGAWLVFGLLGPRLGWSRGRTGAVILVCGLGNTTFLGYPLIETLVGHDAMGVAVVADQLGSFPVLISLAVVIASLYAGRTPHPGLIVKRIFTFPAFLALLLGIAINIAGGWPQVVSDALAPIAVTLTPVALFSVGLQFKLNLGNRQMLGAACLGWCWKLLAAPALAFAVGVLAGIEGTIFQVGVLQAGMAPMVSATILANEYELDPPLANSILGVGIVLSLASVPLIDALIG